MNYPSLEEFATEMSNASNQIILHLYLMYELTQQELIEVYWFINMNIINGLLHKYDAFTCSGLTGK